MKKPPRKVRPVNESGPSTRLAGLVRQDRMDVARRSRTIFQRPGESLGDRRRTGPSGPPGGLHVGFASLGRRRAMTGRQTPFGGAPADGRPSGRAGPPGRPGRKPGRVVPPAPGRPHWPGRRGMRAGLGRSAQGAVARPIWPIAGRARPARVPLAVRPRPPRVRLAAAASPWLPARRRAPWKGGCRAQVPPVGLAAADWSARAWGGGESHGVPPSCFGPPSGPRDGAAPFAPAPQARPPKSAPQVRLVHHRVGRLW
jgi:hypothetical protein